MSSSSRYVRIYYKLLSVCIVLAGRQALHKCLVCSVELSNAEHDDKFAYTALCRQLKTPNALVGNAVMSRYLYRYIAHVITFMIICGCIMKSRRYVVVRLLQWFCPTLYDRVAWIWRVVDVCGMTLWLGGKTQSWERSAKVNAFED